MNKCCLGMAAPSAIPDGEPMVFDRAVMDCFVQEIGGDSARGLLAIFFNDAQGRAGRMIQSVDNRVDLRLEAHSLKSATATFGFMVVSAQAAGLELKADSMRRPDLVQSLAGLIGAFAQARGSVPSRDLETAVRDTIFSPLSS